MTTKHFRDNLTVFMFGGFEVRTCFSLDLHVITHAQHSSTCLEILLVKNKLEIKKIDDCQKCPNTTNIL